MSRYAQGGGSGPSSGASARRSALARWLPVLGWALVILGLTSVPNPPSVAATLPPGIDKVTHAGLYFVLGALVGRAVGARGGWGSLLFVAIAGMSLFGAADELHQLLVPGRSADIADWLADTLGAAIGFLTAQFQLARTRREIVP